MTRRCVIITGTRYATEWHCAGYVPELDFVRGNDVVLHGDTRGIDRLVSRELHSRPTHSRPQVIAMPAQWERYGKAAGPRRNDEMARVALSLRACGYGVVCLAFPAKNRPSPGTRNMMDAAYLHDFDVRVVPLEVGG